MWEIHHENKCSRHIHLYLTDGMSTNCFHIQLDNFKPASQCPWERKFKGRMKQKKTNFLYLAQRQCVWKKPGSSRIYEGRYFFDNFKTPNIKKKFLFILPSHFKRVLPSPLTSNDIKWNLYGILGFYLWGLFHCK